MKHMDIADSKKFNTLLFVEAPLTGCGLMHVRWAVENDFDAIFITSDENKYSGVIHSEVLFELRKRGRLLQSSTTEGTRVPRQLVAAMDNMAGKTGVICLTDRNLLFAAALAEELAAPFASAKAIGVLRDKRAARKLFDELALPTARWCAPTSINDISVFVRDVGGAVVVKNSLGTGSLDVQLCINESQAVETFRCMNESPRYLDGALMVEEYLYGPLVSMETLVMNGKPVSLGVTDRQLGPLPYFCEVSYSFPVLVPEQIVTEMLLTIEALVMRLGITSGFLHVEFVVTKIGPRLVEVNPRLGGGLLSRMMDDCLTVPSSELLAMSAFGAVGSPPGWNGMTASTVTVYPSRRGRLLSLNGLDQAESIPFVREVTPLAKIGDAVAPPRDYRGALCQIRSATNSAALAFNSALTAAQLVTAELEE